MLGILLLPQDKKPLKHERFDFAGAALLAPALVALIYFLNMGLKEGWASPAVVVSYVVFTIGMVTFLVVERQSDSPMVDLKYRQEVCVSNAWQR
ncbi:hypothetical protein [Alicyclobacillus acidiphilus]|uniref:hypothetical protein n=1 Tax=Alicyclobacillus acidiphilus TaxID=182455 RepID=UPI0012ECDCA8|nr:hypothetical protein [Alicyclobacillus acidiphilus]